MTSPATTIGRTFSTCTSTAQRHGFIRCTTTRRRHCRATTRRRNSNRARCRGSNRAAAITTDAPFSPHRQKDRSMADALVQSAIAHWGPRFVSNGVALTDFEEVCASIGKWDDWCKAWSARAALHEQMGRDALAKKKLLSAGEHLQRAGVYYHFAKFVFVHDIAQMKAAHMKAVECRNLALPHIDPPGERVAIPFEGKTLYGILRKPAGIPKPPLLIMAVGLDSAKEETEAYERPYLARGIATLVFDGPGQGEGEYDFGIRGDYEVAVRAVVDYVMTRSDLDSAR